MSVTQRDGVRPNLHEAENLDSNPSNFIVFTINTKADQDHTSNNKIAVLISRLLFQLWLIGCCVCFVSLAQAQGPENTLVVVNAESQDSLAVANLYVELRKIPACNVVYLSGVEHPKLGPETGMSRDFVRQIGQPIMAAIKERKLEKQISCITYSAGFPTRIQAGREAEKYRKNRGLGPSRIWYGPYSSLTSLTYFYHDAFSETPEFFLDPNAANRYASARDRSWLINPFSGEAGKQFEQAQKAFDTGDFSAAVKLLSKLRTSNPRQIAVVYSLARALAASGQRDKAVSALSKAKSLGFHWGSAVLNDPAFSKLKKDEQFKTLLTSIGDSSDKTLPSRNFSAGDFWAQNGWPNGNSDQGQKYYLSTMLAITGDRKSSLDSALKQIRRSCSADDTHPKASVYFAKHKDVRSRTREKQFDGAVKELKSLGSDPIVGSAKMATNKKAVIGATLGSPQIDIRSSGSQFAPGAICDNLTSFGGWWGQKSQTPLSVYLDNGAAGASGTVFEPFAISNKFPTARLHVHYARGCTLAESFYQSIVWPSQLLIVGDPLCCPYGDFPAFEVAGLKQGAVIKSNFTLRINEASNSPKIHHYEIYYDGVFTAKSENTSKIRIAIDMMSDGFHELRIVGVADTPSANRTSKRFGFTINQKNQRVSLETATTKQVRMGRKLKLTASSTLDGQIQILQNSRVVASLTSRKIVDIETHKLGLGETELKAIITTSNGSIIASSPLTIEIVE